MVRTTGYPTTHTITAMSGSRNVQGSKRRSRRVPTANRRRRREGFGANTDSFPRRGSTEMAKSSADRLVDLVREFLHRVIGVLAAAHDRLHRVDDVVRALD